MTGPSGPTTPLTPVTTPQLLPTWRRLERALPLVVATMRRYLAQDSYRRPQGKVGLVMLRLDHSEWIASVRPVDCCAPWS